MENIKCKDCGEEYDPSGPHFCLKVKNKTQQEGESSQNITNQNGSKTFWILMGVGLLVYIIRFFGFGNISFFGLLGMIIAGLVISKIIAYVFSTISREKSKRRKKITWAIVFLIVSIINIVVLLLAQIPSPTPYPKPTPPITPISPITNPTSPSISNPDYLKNTSVYVVDDKNAINAGIYSDDVASLWVEDIYSPIGLKVSYVIERGGRKILKFGDIPLIRLDNLGWVPEYKLLKNVGESTLQCWRDGAVKFLRTNVLHKRVQLTLNEANAKIDTVLVEGSSGNPPIDILVMILGNGYGVPSYSASSLSWLNNNDPYKIHLLYLLDLTGIASLEKRGLWGTCQ